MKNITSSIASIMLMGILMIHQLNGQDAFCNYVQTSQNATIVFPVDLAIRADGLPLDSGTVISAVIMRSDTLMCIGSAEYQGQATAMTIYGAEGSDPGINVGEEFTFVAQLPGGCVLRMQQASYLQGGIYDAENTYKVNGISGLDSLAFESDFEVTANITSVSAAGNDGRISLVVNGGFPPYAFTWNDKTLGNGSMISELSNGTYQVVVTDRFGCTEMLSLVVDLNTATSNNQQRSGNFDVYLLRDQTLKLQFKDLDPQEVAVFIYSMDGRMIQNQKVRISNSNEGVLIAPKINASGLYVVSVYGRDFWANKVIWMN